MGRECSPPTVFETRVHWGLKRRNNKKCGLILCGRNMGKQTLGAAGERYLVESGKSDLSKPGQAVAGRTS